MSGTTSGNSISVTANNSTAARTLSSRFGDTLTPTNFKAALDGVTDDTAALLATRNAAPNDGVITVPTGSRLNLWQNPGDNAGRAATGPVLWQLNGMKWGTGNGTVWKAFENDEVETFFQGGKYIFRQSSTGADAPLLRLDYNSTHTGGPSGTQHAMWLNTNVVGTPNSYAWPLLSEIHSSADGGAQNVAIAGFFWKQLKSDLSALTPTTQGSGYTHATVTVSGGGGNGAMFAAIISNGAITGYTLVSGGDGYTKNNLPIVIIIGDGTGAGAVAVVNPKMPNAPNFAANFESYDTTGLTSSNSGCLVTSEIDIVADGADDFAFACQSGAMVQGIRVAVDVVGGRLTTGAAPAQHGWGVRVGGDINAASFIRPFAVLSAWSGAAFDAAPGVALNNAPAFRMAANMRFDLSGDNQHTLRYDSTNARLAYAVDGVDIITISNTGAASFAGITNKAAEIRPIRTVTAADNVTQLATDRHIIINKTVGAPTKITLLANPAVGQVINIKDGRGDAATNPITIVPGLAGQKIDTGSTWLINTKSGRVQLIFDGKNFYSV